MYARKFNFKSGVPQGSHLDSLLLKLFINDLVNNFSNCKYLLYSADLRLHCLVSNLSDAIGLKEDLQRLRHWCEHNRLTLNINKCVISGSSLS